jgi:hypothetical protein
VLSWKCLLTTYQRPGLLTGTNKEKITSILTNQ